MHDVATAVPRMKADGSMVRRMTRVMAMAGLGRGGQARADQGEQKGREGRTGQEAAVSITLEHTNSPAKSTNWTSQARYAAL
jgi:hypothetical protein